MQSKVTRGELESLRRQVKSLEKKIETLNDTPLINKDFIKYLRSVCTPVKGKHYFDGRKGNDAKVSEKYDREIAKCIKEIQKLRDEKPEVHVNDLKGFDDVVKLLNQLTKNQSTALSICDHLEEKVDKCVGDIESITVTLPSACGCCCGGVTTPPEPDPEYDLNLIKQVASIDEGNMEVTYNITVTNNGDLTASTFTIEDQWDDSDIVLDDPSWTSTGAQTAEYVYNGSLAPGASTTVSITLSYAGLPQSDMPTFLTNLAQIASDDGDDVDSTPGNNDFDDYFQEDDADTALTTLTNPVSKQVLCIDGTPVCINGQKLTL